MHDIKAIRDNPEAFDAALMRRGLAPLAASLMAIDEARRTAIGHVEKMLARRNAASKEIGDAKKRGDHAHAEDLMIEVTQLSTKPFSYHVAVNNPTDNPIATMLKKSMDLPGFLFADMPIEVPAGGYLVVQEK